MSQLTAVGEPVQKMKTLEATCDSVAFNARAKKATDLEIGHDMQRYGCAWRNDYMVKISKANVQNLNASIPNLSKKVEVDKNADVGPDEPPIPRIRPGCKEDGVEQLLDQAVLDYKHAASKKTATTDEDAAQALLRRKETRKEKQERIAKRKAEFEKEKANKAKQKKAKQDARRAIEIQNARAQSVTANAIAAGVQAQAHNAAMFSSFLSMYAARHNLEVPLTNTSLPSELPEAGLTVDHLLAKHTENEEEKQSTPDKN